MHTLCNLVSVERELTQLFVLVSKGLVVILYLSDLVLVLSNQFNVVLQHLLILSLLASVGPVVESVEGLASRSVDVVATKSDCKLLRLQVVLLKIVTLQTKMVQEVFVLAS